MSKTRKRYIAKLAGRCLVLVLCALLWVVAPEEYEVLQGMNFFREFSLLHLLWILWVVDMLPQIFSWQNRVPLGSQKLFARRYRPAGDSIDYEGLHSYTIQSTKAAYKMFALWWALLAVIGMLYYAGVVGKTGLFLISVFFYVCDLICVLIWCPFRVMMKTRCCTTCRIFNWDHMMMFSPMTFLGSFYGMSLVVLSWVAFLVWEVYVMMYPERFWDRSNKALRCSECTDKLCTQCCPKKRK